MLFLLFFVAYHDVTAACMFVPVWGHLTNTMNVDIVQSFFFFFFSPKVFNNFPSALSCHWLPEKNDRTSVTVLLGPQTEYKATLNLLVLDCFDHYESHHCLKQNQPGLFK